MLRSLYDNDSVNQQKEFFISNTNCEQSVFGVIAFPVFLILDIIPRNIFSFSGNDEGQPPSNPRFKMVLWFFVAGTRGGANRAKILNLLKDMPMNAHEIAKTLNLDHKTVSHHLKILSKNDLIEKAEKTYGAEYRLSQIMNSNQNVLAEIMEKIGTK